MQAATVGAETAVVVAVLGGVTPVLDVRKATVEVVRVSILPGHLQVHLQMTC